MYYYLSLFARVQKVTKKTHQTQCYVLRPHHCFTYEVGDHPSFGRDPARQPTSSIAINVLLTDSHSAFDKGSDVVGTRSRRVRHDESLQYLRHCEAKAKYDGKIIYTNITIPNIK